MESDEKGRYEIPVNDVSLALMNDEELLEQFRHSGDRNLLEEIIRRNFDRVYRFVASMLGNHEAVDDLVQDVLLSMTRNLHRFRGDSGLATWIYRIASNRVRRFYETQSKNQTVVDSTQLQYQQADESETVEAKELKTLIDNAISELSPALRAAILLTCVEGLPTEEAARVEGCSVANIHWRVHKARTILKGKLAKYLEIFDE